MLSCQKMNFPASKGHFIMFQAYLFLSILSFKTDFFQNLKHQKCPIKNRYSSFIT